MKKEFIQVRRDRNMLRIIFAMPIIQLLLMGYAVNTDVKRLATDIYDFDQSVMSREYIHSFEPGDYFIPQDVARLEPSLPLWDLEQRFESGDAEVALIIPNDFSERLSDTDQVTVGMVIDGADANAARAAMGYAAAISGRYSRSVTGMHLPVEIRQKFLYNPELESVYYMVPGIVATLLTMVTVMLTSMAIVREREMGTLEQLTVTPISVTALMLGKITTFAILGFVEMIVALIVGVVWFGIPFVGSWMLLFALSALYLLTTLGIGMFFSTVTSTQQQAMFFAWFFSIFAILTSGFFTPIGNMPESIQYVSLLNPLRYFMEIVRGIMMKGSSFADLLGSILPLVVYGLAIFTIAASRFRKRTV